MKSPCVAGPTVLVVDSDERTRDVLSRMSKTVLGADVIKAGDGCEALGFFRCIEPDIVITDATLPDMNGITLLKKLKDLNPAIFVILVTGYPSLELVIQGMKDGASDFITRPFIMDQVRLVLNRAWRVTQLFRGNGDPMEEEIDRFTLEGVHEKLSYEVKELSALYFLGETIASFPLNRDTILNAMVKVARDVTLAGEVLFLVPRDGSFTPRNAVSVDGRLDRTGRVWDGVQHQAEKVLQEAVAFKKPILVRGQAGRAEKEDPGLSQMAIPLLIQGEVFGVLYAAGEKNGGFNTQDLQFMSELAKRVSLGLENKYLYESVFDVLMSTLRSLVSTIEVRDPYTRKHSQRVTDLSMIIAKEMRCSLQEMDTLRVGGYLHDIGKIGVRDSVLLKPGKLTPEEFEQIKAHPVTGENIIAPIGFFPEERALIRHHHEQWDGKGYPDGLGGQEIPILARILTVADAFDAMTSDRPYRSRMSVQQSLREIVRYKGTRYDPEVVEAFGSVNRFD